MGAGHCPWGGHTDRIVCNTDGQVHTDHTFVPKFMYLGPRVLATEAVTHTQNSAEYNVDSKGNLSNIFIDNVADLVVSVRLSVHLRSYY